METLLPIAEALGVPPLSIAELLIPCDCDALCEGCANSSEWLRRVYVWLIVSSFSEAQTAALRVFNSILAFYQNLS